MKKESTDIFNASSYKPICKLRGKVGDSHYAYYHHIDIDHGYGLRRKYDK